MYGRSRLEVSKHSTRYILVGVAGSILGSIGTALILREGSTIPDEKVVIDYHEVGFLADEKKKEIASQIMKYGWPSKTNIKVHEGFVLSYDRRTRNPAWVCEHLQRDKLEKDAFSVSRQNCKFKADESVPLSFRSKPSDYLKSGYDRGHMAPARDMQFSQNAMNSSFLLTNISPQTGKGFNRDYWNRVERFTRHLTKHYKNVHVITGPLFIPKKSKHGKHYVKYEVIGEPPLIAVPTHFFKVILAEKSNGTFLREGFVIPNHPLKENVPLLQFKEPIESIEKMSGLIFFDRIAEAKKAYSLCDDTKCSLQSKYKKAQMISAGDKN